MLTTGGLARSCVLNWRCDEWLCYILPPCDEWLCYALSPGDECGIPLLSLCDEFAFSGHSLVLMFFSLRFSSTLSWFVLKSNRLEADKSGVLPAFPQKSLLSWFWASLLGPYPDEPDIDLTVISILGITILVIAVKIASCMRFSTVETVLSRTLLILLSVLFSVT